VSILTPPVISRLPLGLIRFLGIQSGGVYPQSLSPQLQTSWDTFQLLHANHHETVTQANPAVAAIGVLTIANTFVPNGEAWYVRAASVNIVAGAGEAWSGQLVWVPFGAPGAGTIGHPLTLVIGVAGAAGQSVQIGSLQQGASEGFFMGPGDILAINTVSLTGTIDLTTVAQISRFPI